MSADSVEQHYVDGFVANLSNAPQQMGARLVTAVESDLSYARKGEMFNADDIQADEDAEQEITGRAPDSPASFSENVRRVGFFMAKNFGRFIDDLDTVRMLSDPTNPTMRGMMATKARATDDAIIDTLFGTAREGKTGGTSVAFTSAQTIAANNRDFLHAQEADVVAASGDLPLTVGKIIKASVMLDASELEGPRFFAYSAKQKGNLLASTPTTSQDYQAVRALVNGEVNTFMGFTFIRTERLPVASNVRDCAAWVKSAVQYKERPIHNARITQRADKSFRWYAYYEVERGGVRRYDGGVVKVQCSEA